MSYTASLCRTCRFPNASSDDRPVATMNGQERAKFGCVCTFENADGKRLVLHEPGAPAKGLRAACAAATALDESFRLVCYSTPATVYGDMQGMRMTNTRVSREVTVSDRATLPEVTVLGQIGLLHMLHPRLVA
jgi:hypothetical protein